MMNAHRPLKIFFLSILSMALFGASFLFYQYAKTGLINGEKIASIHEANILMRRLEKEKFPNSLLLYVNSGEIHELTNALKDADVTLRKVHTVSPNSDRGIYDESFIVLKNNTMRLVAFPQIKNLVKVYYKKISQFQFFVEKNNWRTLTRVSKRVLAYLNVIHVYNFNELKKINGRISRELDYMKKITENSVLSRGQKALIFKKLDSLKVESNMLNDYIKELRLFNKSFKKFEFNYKKWKQIVYPDLNNSQVKIRKDSKKLTFYFLGLVGMLLLFVIFSPFVLKYFDNKSSLKIQNKVMELINEGVLLKKNSMFDDLPEGFKKKIIKSSNYVIKRMSFSTIFQESLPFPAFLLDSNMQVIWANELFFETWNIDKGMTIRENISWDFLQQFTNLGKDDPMYLALESDIAGIYQIQIKCDQERDAWPFELYVSPVTVDGEKRVMAILYSLSSLEMTLAEQTQTLLSPIEKTIDSLCDESFKGQLKNKLYKNFEVAGIGRLYKKFCQLNEYFNLKKKGYANEIDQLESKNSDISQLVQEGFMPIAKSSIEIKEIFKRTKKFKKEIIKNAESNILVETHLNNVLKNFKSMLGDYSKVLEYTSSNEKKLHSGIQLIDNFKIFKDDFKKISQIIGSARLKILESVEKLLIGLKSPQQSNEKIENGLSQLKSELKGFDKITQSFSDTFIKFDVLVSKVDMVLADREKNESISGEIEFLSEKILKNKNFIEEFNYEVNKISNKSSMIEENLVAHLKSFYSALIALDDLIKSSVSIFDGGKESQKEAQSEQDVQNKALVSQNGPENVQQASV